MPKMFFFSQNNFFCTECTDFFLKRTDFSLENVPIARILMYGLYGIFYTCMYGFF